MIVVASAKNLLEMNETTSGPEEGLGVENEADDEATTGGNEGNRREISASWEKGWLRGPGERGQSFTVRKSARRWCSYGR
jgi:hypothetical protein